MGRYRTGAIFTSEARKLDLSFLLKQGLIKKDASLNGVINWSVRNEPNGSMGVLTKHTPNEKWIRLSYTITDVNGVQTEYNYKIDLVEVDSNLGKGKLLYMVCPESRQRCRILYMAYGYHKFKSREAYQNRLYYDTQKCSKNEIYNTKYHELESRLNKMLPTIRTSTFKGKPTKRVKRYERLSLERDFCDNARWSQCGMTKSMWRAMATGQYDDLIRR